MGLIPEVIVKIPLQSLDLAWAGGVFVRREAAELVRDADQLYILLELTPAVKAQLSQQLREGAVARLAEATP